MLCYTLLLESQTEEISRATPTCDANLYKFPPCDANLSKYMPCEDAHAHISRAMSFLEDELRVLLHEEPKPNNISVSYQKSQKPSKQSSFDLKNEHDRCLILDPIEQNKEEEELPGFSHVRPQHAHIPDCPERGALCRVLALSGYRVPFRWPQSRDSTLDDASCCMPALFNKAFEVSLARE
jgi:hypothetical protein